MKIYPKAINNLSVIILSLFALLLSAYGFAASDAHITLTKSSFKALDDWEQDDHSQALLAFQHSCDEILSRDPESFSSPLLHYASTQQWQAVCKAAKNIHRADALTSRRFFESKFVPYHLSEDDQHEGLFTGYYLPLIEARFQPSKRFNVPIHALPKNLVKVDLGLFRPELAGKSIVGQVRDNKLSPYPDRVGITGGDVSDHADVLAWSDNPVDVYFAQIQGSAMVRLPDNKHIVIGYAGDNGHKYLAIGKVLISRGELNRENVSMQTIREWLLKHPGQASELLNQNASYVFFRILKDNNPLGTEKVGLTPERSLAVDNRYIPFGAPVWIKTSIPAYRSDQLDQSEKSVEPFRHLVVAQDTGGAIKGVVRGDIYWGTGNKAEYIAGRMNQAGESWVLLPR